jgi:hypothetical protein
MEIRHQFVHRAETVAWADEDARLPRAGGDAPRLVGDALQRARRRRPDRPDPSPRRARLVQRRRRTLRDDVRLLVHDVRRRVLDLDRLERPRTDVEKNVDAAHAPRREPREELRRHVQPRRRRGDGAALARVDGLISLGVVGRVGALDVGGERDVAVPLDRLRRIALHVEPHDAGAARGDLDDLDVEARGDVDDASRLQLPAGRDHRLVRPARVVERLEQEHLGGRARIADPEQAGAEDPGRVQDDRIARRGEVGEVAEAVVRDRARRAVDDHEP